MRTWTIGDALEARVTKSESPSAVLDIARQALRAEREPVSSSRPQNRDGTTRASVAAKADAAGLLPNQLGTADLTASTVANIGPGIDFYFGFGIIVTTAGVAAPLTILAAALAVGLLAWTVSEFTRAEPSAGSFITYVESAFGRRAGVATALLVTVGYTVAMAGVITMSGGFISLTLAHFSTLAIPWAVPTLLIALAALALMIRGVRLSTTVVAVAVSVQVLIMVVVCVVVLVEHGGQLSATPLRWSQLTGGLAGLSAGFPLALYMFIGWENGPALAEETRDPRSAVPRALALSVGLATLLFLLFAYSTIVGLHYDVGAIRRSSIPFLTVADEALGPAAFLAWMVGILSILATFLAGTSSQARMLYDGGREGFLPRPLAKIHPRFATPVNALATIVLAGLVIIGLWGVCHLLGVGSGSMDPVGLYAECSTFGTIIILVVYVATSCSLPFFIWRRHRERFHVLRHVAVPALGAAALVIPFIELFSPGQPAPYDAYPFVVLAVVLACVLVALSRRHTSGTTSAER
jgi:amino acid transporter